ncbi:MAG TPA: glycosyltransferase [Geminicoccus sp.]|uniref:glycosyltransferase n=1 Tax=Geminicoccus sp. TaxID=2024832 RepID=UPI002BE8E8FA|nr:glycosyltransferase [Geminicoccus sp.]HWL71221.1 glycosyltransferase [Geminicoccus sp.]
MTHDLIFFPDYRAANPYQELLYRQLAHLHPRAGTIDNALRLLDHAPPGRHVVFHLHWEDVLHRHLADPDAAAGAVHQFLAKAEDFTGRGGTLFWTVHNQRSHVGSHPELDRTLRQALARLADRVHVHSLAALRAIRAELALAPTQPVVVPHGNYRPIHDPRATDRDAARIRQGFAGNDIVLLLFGRLDAYKGASALLAAFAEAPACLRLVVAGKQIVPLTPVLAALPASVRTRITVHDRFVPTAEVDRLLAAADAVVLPYRAILTSGTLMLALGFGRPVIAPDLPALAEIVADGREALLYPHDRPDGLHAALLRLVELDAAGHAAMAKEAAATAELYDWRWIGRQMGAAILDAAMHGRAVRRPVQLSVPAAVPA